MNSGSPAPSGSSSGCQSTPRQNALRRILDALDQAVGRRRRSRPGRRRRGRGPGGGASGSRPRGRPGSRAAARREMSTSWRPNSPSRGRCGAPSVTSPTCCCRSPPYAMLSSWKPRQTPSTGRSRAIAPRVSASSARSRRTFGRVGRGVRLGPVVRRPDVLAADQDQPVEDLEHAGRVVGRVIGVGRHQQRDAAGRVHALDVALRDHAGGHVGPRAPARAAPVGADADARPHRLHPLEGAVQLPVGDGALECLLLRAGRR